MFKKYLLFSFFSIKWSLRNLVWNNDFGSSKGIWIIESTSEVISYKCHLYYLLPKKDKIQHSLFLTGLILFDLKNNNWFFQIVTFFSTVKDSQVPFEWFHGGRVVSSQFYNRSTTWNSIAPPHEIASHYKIINYIIAVTYYPIELQKLGPCVPL